MYAALVIPINKNYRMGYRLNMQNTRALRGFVVYIFKISFSFTHVMLNEQWELILLVLYLDVVLTTVYCLSHHQDFSFDCYEELLFEKTVSLRE